MDALLPDPPAQRELDVVGIGEISLDHVAEVDRFPLPGDKRALAGYHRLAGGQMATAMRACARLGLRAGLVGSVGADEAGELALAPLRADGVDLAGVRTVAGAATRFAWILVEREGGERTVLWQRDPALRLAPADLGRDEVVRGRALHVDASDPELSLWAAGSARAAGIPVFVDADTDAEGVRALLRVADFPVISQGLARALAGSEREADALRALAEEGARYPVVTLGERGAIAGAPGAELRLPAHAVSVRDTTGAGDVFHAAFVAAALDGRSGPDAVRFANAAAALSCRGLGAQGALPSSGEVDALLRGAG